jgi:hypothetical protein
MGGMNSRTMSGHEWFQNPTQVFLKNSSWPLVSAAADLVSVAVLMGIG